MAAAVMKHIYEKRGLAGVIESAGTLDWSAGRPADPDAVRIAMEHGIKVGNHRARQIQPNDFERFDLIVTLDRSNFRTVSQMAPQGMRAQIRTLITTADGQPADVPDPYQCGEQSFRRSFELIYRGCVELADELPKISCLEK